jgi:hypothetical protein
MVRLTASAAGIIFCCRYRQYVLLKPQRGFRSKPRVRGKAPPPWGMVMESDSTPTGLHNGGRSTTGHFVELLRSTGTCSGLPGVAGLVNSPLTPGYGLKPRWGMLLLVTCLACGLRIAEASSKSWRKRTSTSSNSTSRTRNWRPSSLACRKCSPIGSRSWRVFSRKVSRRGEHFVIKFGHFMPVIEVRSSHIVM